MTVFWPKMANFQPKNGFFWPKKIYFLSPPGFLDPRMMSVEEKKKFFAQKNFLG